MQKFVSCSHQPHCLPLPSSPESSLHSQTFLLALEHEQNHFVLGRRGGKAMQIELLMQESFFPYFSYRKLSGQRQPCLESGLTVPTKQVTKLIWLFRVRQKGKLLGPFSSNERFPLSDCRPNEGSRETTTLTRSFISVAVSQTQPKASSSSTVELWLHAYFQIGFQWKQSIHHYCASPYLPPSITFEPRGHI